MKTMIGIPCMDKVDTRFVTSLMGMKRVGETHINFKVCSLIYDSRNQICADAIEAGADRILWIDSDMRFDPDAMERLSADMDETGAEYVSGIFFGRSEKCPPVIYRSIEPPEFQANGMPKGRIDNFDPYPKDSLFDVAGSGFGFAMTSVDLIRRVWDKYGPPFSPYSWCGEDLSFCYRVRRMGVKMLCDSRVKVGHLGQAEYNERTYESRKKGAGG